MRSYMTELECCVLLIVKTHEPCTAYTVRRKLAESASSFWSGSAGAVYPLLGRLAERRLVETEGAAWGEGAKKLFRLTRTGRAELKHWLRELPDWSGAVTMDAIRTRVFALDALTPRERDAFLARANALTKAAIDRLRREIASLRAAGRTWEAIGTTGALREVEARLDWLKEVKKAAR